MVDATMPSSSDAAKAAAQADFERRILSALAEPAVDPKRWRERIGDIDGLLPAEPAGEAKPVTWATVRVEDTPDGLLIHPDDAKEWGLQDDYPYKGTFLPDGRYRIALTTPPDASAITKNLSALIDLLEHAVRIPGYGQDANSREEAEHSLDRARAALAGAKP